MNYVLHKYQKKTVIIKEMIQIIAYIQKIINLDCNSDYNSAHGLGLFLTYSKNYANFYSGSFKINNCEQETALLRFLRFLDVNKYSVSYTHLTLPTNREV